ncbi:MAG: phosphotransferase [Thermodesulfobacteriota bacterium]
MTRLPPDHRLTQTLRRILGPTQVPGPRRGEVLLERLPASHRVFCFTFPGDTARVVGKFFSAYPPATAKDRDLSREYHNYLEAPAWGLNGPEGPIPRLLGHCPEMRLGLLLEAIPGPDLDSLLARASGPEGPDSLYPYLEKLARLLAFFHRRPLAAGPVTPSPALAYLAKLVRQLAGQGLLASGDEPRLEKEGGAWERLLENLPDRQVLIHGDATPTNFLFPDGRAVALDLERLRVGDRLWDLSWVAGELKHAWGWRAGDFLGAEGPIRHFFQAYLETLGADAALTRRLLGLNPFYMALAELRIARNAYLSWDYRRTLLEEALRCLTSGRRNL